MENITKFQNDFQHSLSISRYLFTPIYSLVLFFGLIGNLGALYYFIFKIKQKSPSNIYIINLAVADMLFLFALPFRIHYHLNDSNWIFGDAMCRITGTIFFANIYISISFMTCICVDRYIATLHPHTYLQLRNTNLTALVSTAVWLVSGSAMLVFMLKCPLTSKGNMCFEGFSQKEWSDLAPYSISSLIFGSLLPSAVILVCYPIVAHRIARIKNSTARGARRIIYAILAITLLCFLPYHIVHLVYLLTRLKNTKENDVIFILRRVTMALVSLNSILDPLLYYFATGHYKWRLKRLRLRKKTGVYSISNGF
ncbi:uracil nucleotide/cysteinyl leukotriene receptor-like [Cyprinus carpio]|uniref:Uracil nucleotide/cysteinyl leukotriene receptor-like n=2 Tax=Cyprinus carpio TaxID=7962 RepID=A0A9Q9UZY5_CYPCA|nr:uracil nucleotide/cysteinyl leukotriene receptor-like [Cyprinus carpio]XP_018926167.1 uracil nucleotide/cysteinyl leukotriene receptor-like [Cyprinus carpio]